MIFPCFCVSLRKISSKNPENCSFCQVREVQEFFIDYIALSPFLASVNNPRPYEHSFSQITVQVQVKGGKVASVKVVKHGETAMLVGAAEKKLAKQIVANNGTEGVNAVTGASNSSKGIIAAVNQALAKAK